MSTARAGVDRLGRTPLHYAALEGRLVDVERLLNAGADPSAQDDHGFAPLHFATQSRALERVITELSTACSARAPIRSYAITMACLRRHWRPLWPIDTWSTASRRGARRTLTRAAVVDMAPKTLHYIHIPAPPAVVRVMAGRSNLR